MAPFFKLTEQQRVEYDKASISMLKELEFWALYNDKYIETDRDYWTLLATFERYMDSPSPQNEHRLKTAIKSLQEMGADGDWLWEIYDEINDFLELKLWPWLNQLWAGIILQDFELMEKVLYEHSDFSVRKLPLP